MSSFERDSDLATALLAAIVDSSDDAIASKDLNGIVTSWNRSAERLFGYTAEEMIGRPIAVIANPATPDEMPEILRRLRAGERIDHFETQRRRKDGTLVHISLTVSPIHDRTGKIVGASKIARDITQQVELRQRLEMLRREVDHRAKNVLQIVQALLHLTRAETLDQYIGALEGRIRTLAAAHTQVAENAWRGAEIDLLLRETLAPFHSTGERVAMTGPKLFIGADAAQALAITIHELATNASKYGAWSVKEGRVSLSWSVASDQLRVDWRERGGPSVSAPTTYGYGMRVIESLIPHQTHGEVDLTWSPQGLDCALWIPTKRLGEVPAAGAAPP